MHVQYKHEMSLLARKCNANLVFLVVTKTDLPRPQPFYGETVSNAHCQCSSSHCNSFPSKFPK